MVAKEFEDRKNILYRYFHHPKWKIDDEDSEWEYKYYKGRKNLEELKNALQIVFDPSEYTLLSESYFRNAKEEIIGGSVTCSFWITSNMNGIWQGSGESEVFVKFTLTRYGYFYNQGQTAESVK